MLKKKKTKLNRVNSKLRGGKYYSRYVFEKRILWHDLKLRKDILHDMSTLKIVLLSAQQNKIDEF